MVFLGFVMSVIVAVLLGTEKLVCFGVDVAYPGTGMWVDPFPQVTSLWM